MYYQILFSLSMIVAANALLSGCTDSGKSKQLPPFSENEPNQFEEDLIKNSESDAPQPFSENETNQFEEDLIKNSEKNKEELIQDLEKSMLRKLNTKSPFQVKILNSFSKLIIKGVSEDKKYVLTEENLSNTVSGFITLLKQNLLVKLPRSEKRTYDLTPTYSIFTKRDFDGVSDEMKKELAIHIEGLESSITTAFQKLLLLKGSKRYELTAREQLELIYAALNSNTTTQDLSLDLVNHIPSRPVRDFQRAQSTYAPLTINIGSHELNGVSLPWSYVGIIKTPISTKHNDNTFIASINGTNGFLETRLNISSTEPGYQYSTRLGYDFEKVTLSLNYYELSQAERLQTIAVEYFNTFYSLDSIKVFFNISTHLGCTDSYFSGQGSGYTDLSSLVMIEHQKGIKASFSLSINPTVCSYCFYINYEH